MLDKETAYTKEQKDRESAEKGEDNNQVEKETIIEFKKVERLYDEKKKKPIDDEEKQIMTRSTSMRRNQKMGRSQLREAD